MTDKNKSKANKDPEAKIRQDSDKLLDELRTAYKSINELQKTSSHRRISLELEKKIREANKSS